MQVISGLDRAELYAARLGDAGPQTLPLVLVPGGPGSPETGALGVGPGFDHTVFRPEMDALAADFALIYYDAREASARWRLEDDVIDLDSVRVAFGVERWAVLGWGYGATVAQFYALRYPDRVEALILLDPMPASAAWDTETLANAERFQARNLDTLRARLDEATLGALDAQLGLFPLGMLADPLAVLDWPAREWQPDLARFEAFMQNNGPEGRPGEARDYRALLPGIRARTLILWGAGDPAPLAAAEEIRDLIPGAERRILEGVGAMPWLEDMPGLRAALCEFLGCAGVR